MTARRPEEPRRQHHGCGKHFFPSLASAPAWPWVPRDRVEVRLEVLTLALSVPGAPTIIVVVTVHDLPTWWLIVAGMLIGWASDAVTTLVGHWMGLRLARRASAIPPPGDHCAAGDALSERSRATTGHREGPSHRQRPR